MVPDVNSPISLSPTLVLKSVGPKLVPFFKTTIVYFVAWLPHDIPTVFAALIKCLPVLCLIAFVLMQGINLKKQHAYRRYILLGLILSCIGDALLVWHQTQFVSAMAAFGLAHLAYIRAFCIESQHNWPKSKSLPFTIFVGIALYLMYPGLKGVLIPGVGIYIVLINIMAWRAFVQVDILQNTWSWTSLCAFIGSIFFLISDFTIGLNKFCIEIPGARVIIMSTYYAAQCFITLSSANTDHIVQRLIRKDK
eukprot:gene18288-20109_t